MPLVAIFLAHLCLWALQLNRYHRGLQHKQPSHTTLTTRPTTNPHNQTLTTSPHNPPIMASSPSISIWERGACTSINKGGIYCPMCATPRPKRKKVLGAIAGDIAAHTALADAMSGIPSVVGALPAAQAKKDRAKIAGAPKPVANAVAAFTRGSGKKGRDSRWHTRAGGKGVKGVFPGNSRYCCTRKSGYRTHACHEGAWSFSSNWCCSGNHWDGGG
jgi:hypothetical protein